MLNAERLPGPRSDGWSASTIHGNRARGTGVLNNELYIGRLVWNRLRYLKTPETGRRVSRLNSESARIVTEIPEMRIIDQDLWDAVKARQGKLELPERGNRGQVMTSKRQARYLQPGLKRCGACGGGISMISASNVGCLGAQQWHLQQSQDHLPGQGGTPRARRAVGALMEPELFAVFCEGFVAETNRLRAATPGARAAQETELAKLKRDLDRLVQALFDGVPAASVKARMQHMEARQTELERALLAAAPALHTLHTDMAKLYRQKVAGLVEALNADNSRSESAEILRGLIDGLVLTTCPESSSITLTGDLAGILTMSLGTNAKPALARAIAGVQLSLVAGAGFDEARMINELGIRV